MFKRPHRLLGSILLAMGTVALAPAHAAIVTNDDTEIYFQPGSDLGTAPQVMFYIEYTPNLASTICTGVYEDDPLTPDVNEDNIATACPAIAPLKTYLAAGDITATDHTIDQFELTRAALKRVLIGLGGVKIGLLMAHDNLAACSGGPTASYCSQGGYILNGLTEIAQPSANFDPKTATPAQLAAELALFPNKRILFARLDALPSPQGGFSHENQNKEVYFELFRYLTGQGVYNGFNGWADYNTDLKVNYNLGALRDLSPAGALATYNCAPGATCDATTIANGTARFVQSGKDKGYIDGDFAPVDGLYMSTFPLKWDINVIDGSLYKPALTEHCSKVFVVNVVDGGGNSADDANTAINAPLTSGGFGFTVSNSDKGFTEMVGWLHDVDLADGTFGRAGDLSDKQNVTSFFVAKQPQQVDAAAAAGGTGYAIKLGENATEVVDTINKIFNQVLSVSTTFVAASIPVNAFNRSSVIDNAYLALFQVNENAQPNWVGNLKKLKLKIFEVCSEYDPVTLQCINPENILELVDATTTPAISTSDGRIMKDAFTFWTQGNGYDLFDNIDATTEIAGKDGRAVHRGGAGQQIPNFIDPSTGAKGSMNWLNSTSGRRLFTEAAPYTSTTTGLLDIHWANAPYLYPSILDRNDSYSLALWPSSITYTGAYYTDYTKTWPTGCFSYWGSSTTAVSYYYDTGLCWLGDIVSNTIAYMRGYDPAARAFDNKGVVDIALTNAERIKTRRWIMNDPLHSRPRPINYGSRGSGYDENNPDIRILMGSNDGYLRMIRNTNSDGTDSGREVWAFMPRSVMKIQKQLMDNAAGGTPVHPYGLDGAPVEYVYDANSNGTISPSDCTTDPVTSQTLCDQAWIFVGLRRGGRGYYGLNITDPDNPKLMWKLENTYSGFSELGYTFSQPIVRKLKWGSNTMAKPALIFAGGYDTNKDTHTVGTDDSMGRAIYVVDAATGALIWKADSSDGLTDSIPSEVTAYDSSGDGIIDHLYVGDTGGQVWRADLVGSDVSTWKITRILNVGRHYSTDPADDRRFFYPPDVVSAQDNVGRYVGVVIASGNREHPLQISNSDWLYMYKDRHMPYLPSDFTELDHTSLQDVTDNCVQQVGLDCATTFSLEDGWRLSFEDLGEKSLSPALVVRNVIYFNTYVPKVDVGEEINCGPSEGSGYYYEISLNDARAVTNYDSTNAQYDSEGKLITDLQKTDRRVQLASGGIPAENVYVSFNDGNKSYTGILRPDLKAGSDLGRGRWRTYWYEREK